MLLQLFHTSSAEHLTYILTIGVLMKITIDWIVVYIFNFPVPYFKFKLQASN